MAHAAQPGRPVFRLRAVLVGAALILLSLLWMRELELRTGIWVATGVPPLPALLFLALLLVANALLRRGGSAWAPLATPSCSSSS